MSEKGKTKSDVNLREGPGTHFKIVSVLKPDTAVTVREHRGDWLKVEVGGKTGFLHGKFVWLPSNAIPRGFMIHQADASHWKLAPERRRSAPPGAGRSASLCTAEETVLFSCKIAANEGKLLSLCGSKALGEKTGYIQYRFGHPGKVELEFPKEKAGSQSAFRYSRYTRPLVTYLELRFSLGGYRYSIQENHNEEESPPVDEAVIEVSRPDDGSAERSITLRCRQPVTGSLMALEGIVPASE